MGYKRTAIIGAGWLGGLRGATRILSLLKFVVIARILTPDDFGLFGMVALTLALFETLTETGINLVLIQKEKIEKSIDTSFVISLSRGGLISLAMIISAWPVAWFFRDDRVIPFILLACLVPVIRGFINPSLIYFQKRLEFHKESLFRIVLLLVDTIVAIGLVYVLESLSGLIWAMIVAALVEVVLSWYLCRPWPKLKIDWKEFWSIVNFGKWLNVTVIANYLSSQLDSMVVGRYLGTHVLGIYQMAYKLAHAPLIELGNVLNQTMYPIMSTFKKDQQRLWRSVKLIFVPAMLLSLLVVGVMVGWAEKLVLVLLGVEWIGAVDVIPILVLAALVRVASTLIGPLILASGKPKGLAMISVSRTLVMLISIGPLMWIYGLVGVAGAVLLGNIAALPVAWGYAWKIKHV